MVKKANKWIGIGSTALLLFACSRPYDLSQVVGMGSAPNPNDGVAPPVIYGEQGMAKVSDIYDESTSTYEGPTGNYGNFYDDPAYGVNVVGGPQATERDRVIYFSFDSSKLDERSKAVIREHAKFLASNPTIGVVLEGHTDERGSQQYNIGLGERRAYSVKAVFEQSGVSPNQMRVLSYGEERPAVWGSDAESYARNRRVVIIY